LENLKKLPLVFHISIESPNADNHDLIRGKGSFDKTIGSVTQLVNSGFDVHFTVILSKRTSEEIPQMFKFAKQLNIKSVNYTRAIPQGMGKNHFSFTDDILVKEDLKAAMLSIIRSSEKYEMPTNTDKPLFALLGKDLGSSAHAGIQGMIVGYKGDIKASSRTNLILGNVRETTLEQIYFNHPLMVNLRRGNISGCKSCPYLRRCGGDRSVAYAVSGDFLSVDPGCWNYDDSFKEEGA
jgi:radical SAM protein with 4Fe4S-binding SPASM domain